MNDSNIGMHNIQARRVGEHAADQSVLGRPVSLVVGAPGSGKTEFALSTLLTCLERSEKSAEGFGTRGYGSAVMSVSNRKIADELSDKVICARGVSDTARPVTTLSAVAFRLLTASRAGRHETVPKLLNGAEQDAMLRAVVAVHVGHAESGELCGTCELLRRYFAADSWAHTVYNGDGGAALQSAGVSRGAGTSEALFARGVNDAFIKQLRDMLARMDELGVREDREDEVLDRLGEARSHSLRTERLDIQWRLAFALRHEYKAEIGRQYPDEFRLDSSNLLVEGASVAQNLHKSTLPELVVVDDFQDLTLAGLRFLEALAAQGVRLTLVGNADEAVQTFRGSYPEYLMKQAVDGPLKAMPVRLEELQGRKTMTQGVPNQRVSQYLDVLASRVSLSISSPEARDTPLALRPGKLPRLKGSLPIERLGAYADSGSGAAAAAESTMKSERDGGVANTGAVEHPETSSRGETAQSDNHTNKDDSVRTALYRSPSEEIDDVVWQIKRRHLEGGSGSDWNSMAVIAHDNSTVRSFGERLRRDGVPVRYSAVTRPLKDEPSVQGLFALIELAALHNDGMMPFAAHSEVGMARFVRSRVAQLLESPLFAAEAGASQAAAPARLAPVDAAMRALESLSQVIQEDGESKSASDEGTVLKQLQEAWNAFDGLIAQERSVGGSEIEVDESLVEGGGGGNRLAFGVDAMYLMLAFGDDAIEGESCSRLTLEAVKAVGTGNAHVAAFGRMWRVVSDVAKRLRDLPANEPQYALWEAWDACHVASRWQRQALGNDSVSREANDRLDAVMQLFGFAAGSGASQSVPDFISSVRSMRIEADSLAKVAPIDQAVTLATPAGAAGRHWDEAWVVQVQQGVWPNLAERNTMLGSEDLADIVLRGKLSDDAERESTGSDPHLLSVLASEQKSFLVALTRAQATVHLSAVLSDDASPSDFLYTYVPERYDRVRDGEPEARRYSVSEGARRYAGLDADPRGLVSAARVELMRGAARGTGEGAAIDADPNGDDDVDDAAATLALLSQYGVPQADPGQWAYLDGYTDTQSFGVAEADTVLMDDAADVGSRCASYSDSAVRISQDDTAQDVVALSPSQVDSIWGCPVCWMLSEKFSGPSPSSSATSFGTLIHKVAQLASEAGLDHPDFMEGSSVDDRIVAITGEMMGMYKERRADPNSIIDPKERYKAIVKDQDAEATLGHIASYFVNSNEPDYLGGKSRSGVLKQEDIPIGTLHHADCERDFTAKVSLDEILETYNAIPGVTGISRSELVGIMGCLVGGWPEGMSETMAVRIHGTIDRLEWRTVDTAQAEEDKSGATRSDGTDATGNLNVRIIDYKTGHKHNSLSMFNDLQLVCYQLGLAFPLGHDGTSLPRMLTPSKAMLFDTEERSSPAYSWTPESLFQPPLFVSGHLNNTAFLARNHKPTPQSLYDIPDLLEEPPSGVGQAAWSGFVGLRGTQAVWALTMISRVFYAAAASRSQRIVARRQPNHYCTPLMEMVCPACAGEVDTVFETRKA